MRNDDLTVRKYLASAAPWAWVDADEGLLDCNDPDHESDYPWPAKPELNYDPFERVELPNAFAKVVDATTAERFARRYGCLGYNGLLRAVDSTAKRVGLERPRGRHWVEFFVVDPMDWVIAQARSVRLVLELLDAWREQGDEQLRRVLQRHRLKGAELAGWESVVPPDPRRGTLWLPVAEGVDLGQSQGYVGYFAFVEDKPRDWVYPPTTVLRDTAGEVITELITANMEHLGWQLWRSEGDAFAVQHRPAGLIEVIWWHVQAVALGGRARLCELPSCRAPFIVTDDRQRFCPGEWQPGLNRLGRSRCAALHQKRKERGKL
jgi:hypothetical protein